MISIRRRLLAGLLALVLTVDGLAGLLSYQRALDSAAALLDYQLRQMALSLRDQGAAAPDLQLPADSDFLIQIWSSEGAAIYTSRPGLRVVSEAPLGYSDPTVDGEPWRAYAMQTPRRVVLVAESTRVRKALAGAVALRTLVPLLILAPLLALAIWWMVVRTLAPIGRVVGEVQRRDADSLEPLAAQDLPREIEPLIAELNRLLGRLGAAFEAQRAFIGDAAHELRSPLTALRVQLQLLQRAPGEEQRRQAQDKLGEAIERCAALVQQLLTLARSEPGAAAGAFAPLDLGAVAREAAADCASLALARGTELELDAAPDLRLAGDAEALRVLLRNLIDNALRYTPPGGRVLARLRAGADGVQLEVEDSGPGIAPALRQRVFDRFYRGSVNGEGGSGLGLAIVKAVAARHRATVELGQSRLGGLKVTVGFAPD